VGVELPLELSREEEAVFQLPGQDGRGLPAVSDAALRIYFRPDTPGHLLVGVGHPKANQPADPDHYRETADPSFIEDVSGRIARRLPVMQDALLVRGYAGLYTITPDWNYLLGAVPEVPGYYLATGGSGHGFKIGPAAGLMVAEQIADGKATTFDIDLFRLSRFKEGQLFRSTYGGNRG
jgi:sarcosine oxidase subunit beta